MIVSIDPLKAHPTSTVVKMCKWHDEFLFSNFAKTKCFQINSNSLAPLKASISNSEIAHGFWGSPFGFLEILTSVKLHTCNEIVYVESSRSREWLITSTCSAQWAASWWQRIYATKVMRPNNFAGITAVAAEANVAGAEKHSILRTAGFVGELGWWIHG